MPPLAKITSDLEGSSYQDPDGGEMYAPLRRKIIETAVAMGYDRATMVEAGVNWSDDHDPFQHVKNHAYPHWVSQCNVRVLQSFEEHLGKEKYGDLMNVRHIALLVKSYMVDLKRPVKFPDSLIIANRLKEVLPDRYYCITTIWSLRQQAIVANSQAYVVFFDYDKGRPADLVKAGGVHLDLYNALVRRKQKEDEIAAKWEEHHPKEPRTKL